MRHILELLRMEKNLWHVFLVTVVLHLFVCLLHVTKEQTSKWWFSLFIDLHWWETSVMLIEYTFELKNAGLDLESCSWMNIWYEIDFKEITYLLFLFVSNQHYLLYNINHSVCICINKYKPTNSLYCIYIYGLQCAVFYLHCYTCYKNVSRYHGCCHPVVSEVKCIKMFLVVI